MQMISGRMSDMDANRESYISEALELARKLTILADEGEAAATCDDGCAVLFGIIRDCAYKIRKRAEHERSVHSEEKENLRHAG
jgi:hypothetical protein